MCAGSPPTGPACCRCSRMPACRNWSTASTHYPLGAGGDGELAGALRRRGRRQPDRRLLRHHASSTSPRWTRCCAGAAAVPPGAGRAQAGVGAVGRQPVSAGAAAAGERYLLHRRALQRQRLEEVARAAGERTTGTAASRWAASRSAKARNALDICTAFVGRDETRRDERGGPPLHRSVNAPLVIDSTETPVIEAALKLHGGKPIINSINFEDGEQHAARSAGAGEADSAPR